MDQPALDPAKFRDPLLTARGEQRAQVALRALDTLWFNTGTLCNIACRNCYIESSPRNDRLAYLSYDEVRRFLDEIARDRLPTRLIGFTGGEPFMNPDLIAMLGETLSRGFDALVLTNAMAPLRHRRSALLALREAHGDRLRIRVSLDHYTPAMHEAALRAGFARLFAELGVALDAHDPVRLMLFPEMDPARDVPEITTACWGILNKSPDSVMCASARMVVKRSGAVQPVVLACTLLPYDARFELGATLAEAAGPVALNHPHCASFCVLGGGACSR